MVLGVGAGLQGGEFSGGAFWSNRRHFSLQLVSLATSIFRHGWGGSFTPPLWVNLQPDLVRARTMCEVQEVASRGLEVDVFAARPATPSHRKRKVMPASKQVPRAHFTHRTRIFIDMAPTNPSQDRGHLLHCLANRAKPRPPPVQIYPNLATSIASLALLLRTTFF